MSNVETLPPNTERQNRPDPQPLIPGPSPLHPNPCAGGSPPIRVYSVAMAELVPARFRDLVTRLYLEPQHNNALFELPRRKWYLPADDEPDLSVRFCGRRAGNPSGPAAGPHTQMAQNLLLSYAAGGRVLELKTVQVLDALEIPRPCIDMATIGYNVEWSQELRIEQSLREYVAGWYLIHIFRHAHPQVGDRLAGPAGDFVFDISVGYDLKGIRSEKVTGFLQQMRKAGPLIDALRAEVPRPFRAARELEVPGCLAGSITLSTFHGCPADEIQAICEYLIGELGFDVIVKMNPPTLGREKLEYLLYDVLGYHELRVNPQAYETVIGFDDAVALCRHLRGFAADRGRVVGFKFSNTLEVLNHRDRFPKDQKLMYLSGQPLHVITMTLTDEFRRAVGADVPISFSAGIDAHNFPLAVACGFVPVTVCSDLLRPGGYARFGSYLAALRKAMKQLGARTIDEYIVRAAERWSSDEAGAGTRDQGSGIREQGTDAERVADSGGRRSAGQFRHSSFDIRHSQGSDEATQRHSDAAAGHSHVPTFPPSHAHAGQSGATGPQASQGRLSSEPVRAAALRNTRIVAAMARNDPRYRAGANRREPRKIDSHLTVFDCLTCDKCLPVCPNAANFTYPTPKVAFEYRDLRIEPDGSWQWTGPARRFAIERERQIACFADFCNECGNCDTFCPEYGGPYIEKPSFHAGRESFERAAPRDGFYVERAGDVDRIAGRLRGRRYVLEYDRARHAVMLHDDPVRVTFDARRHTPVRIEWAGSAPDKAATVDMWAYHTLRHLLAGVLDASRVNQVNIACTNVE